MIEYRGHFHSRLLEEANDMHSCFLQAGAVSNSITIVVIYNQVIPDAEYQQPQVGIVSTKDAFGTRGVSALLRLGKRGGFRNDDTSRNKYDTKISIISKLYNC